MKTETQAALDTTRFWKWFDATTTAAKATPVGEVMTTNKYVPYHNGGGTLAWTRDLGGALLMICDAANGLGDKLDEEYLVGLHMIDGESCADFVEGDAPNLAAAVAWCDKAEAAFAICRKWVKRLGCGFHPDTAGSRYTPALSEAEVEEYETDIEKFFADAPGDPYAFAVMALREGIASLGGMHLSDPNAFKGAKG